MTELPLCLRFLCWSCRAVHYFYTVICVDRKKNVAGLHAFSPIFIALGVGATGAAIPGEEAACGVADVGAGISGTPGVCMPDVCLLMHLYLCL